MTDHAADAPADAPAGAPSPGRRAALWPRVAFMILFAVMVAVAETVLLAVALLQVGWLGFTGAPNPRIRRFGAQLGDWLAAVARYQAVADEAKPFPFADWPARRD